MPTIDWAAFNWQAFATLAAGAMAVTAATVVALRQIKIQSLTLREKLFERRLEVFRGTRRFVHQVHAQHGKFSADEGNLYFEAIAEARFLFGDGIQFALDELWRKAKRYRTITFRLEQIPADDEARRAPLNLERERLQTSIADLEMYPHSIFGRTLDLSEVSVGILQRRKILRRRPLVRWTAERARSGVERPIAQLIAKREKMDAFISAMDPDELRATISDYSETLERAKASSGQRQTHFVGQELNSQARKATRVMAGVILHPDEDLVGAPGLKIPDVFMADDPDAIFDREKHAGFLAAHSENIKKLVSLKRSLEVALAAAERDRQQLVDAILIEREKLEGSSH